MPENPILIFVLILLSAISTFLCWRGFRGGNLPYGIMGVGAAIPTFSLGDWRAWATAAVVVSFGYWLREKMENL